MYRKSIVSISSIALTIIIATAYTATGLFSMMVTEIPGRISIIWLPSGIALAAAIIYGRRSLYGIALGAFVVNLIGHTQNYSLVSILLSVVVTAGSVIQAFPGKEVISRILKGHNPLDSANYAIKYFLTLPVPGVVAALIGVPALVVAGALSPDLAGNSFIFWCIGDTLGMIFFATLLLVGQLKTTDVTPVLIS